MTENAPMPDYFEVQKPAQPAEQLFKAGGDPVDFLLIEGRIRRKHLPQSSTAVAVFAGGIKTGDLLFG